MRILVTGGGTAGHVYPALSILQEIQSQQPNSDAEHAAGIASILYVGARNGLERELVAREGRYSFQALHVRGLRGSNPLAFVGGVGRMGIALAGAHRLIGAFRPEVILGTGGYVCVPVLLAGWMRRIPSVLFLPDLVPGWAGRFLARFATRICVAFPDSLAYLPRDRTVVTGYPVRSSLLQANREQARGRLSLPADERVLLVFGGSRGARSINSMMEAALPLLLDRCTVIHVSGAGDYAALETWRATLREDRRARYRLYAYLHGEMADALAAADLAVCRAGASTMAELPLFALPAVVIPYPYAGGHQELNADYLVHHGAAIKITERELGIEAGERGAAGLMLAAKVLALIDDAARLKELAACSGRLARPEAARTLVQHLEVILKRGR